MPFARVLPVVRNPYSKDSSGTFGFFTQLSMEALRVPAVFDLLNCAVHSLSKITRDHIGHYCLSKMVGPGNAHILGRFPLTGSRLLCHILVLLHKRYKITQNLPLVHKTGEGTCLTKEAVGTCGVQVKSHWSIPFSWIIRPSCPSCQYIGVDHYTIPLMSYGHLKPFIRKRTKSDKNFIITDNMI